MRLGARDPRPLGPHPGRARSCATPATRSHVTAEDADDAAVATTSSSRTTRWSRSAGCGCARSSRPGHTPGSMCFLVEGSPVLFSGDTLFPGGPGRHQVPGRRLPHDHPLDRGQALHRSRPRPVVLPGHGDPTPRSAPSARTSRSGSTGAGERAGRWLTRCATTSGPHDDTPVHTADLPATPDPRPQHPGDGVGRGARRAAGARRRPARHRPIAEYKRRIGPWLLWRAGPATRRRCPLLGRPGRRPRRQVHVPAVPRRATGQGVGPSGATHTRFRAWKEDLRDSTA